ncbi:MAG: hypothetical protein HQL67_06000 [Magnetococcales bacterium]|nr:hypothetical protein [Magnetococcales bacterium]
MNYFATELSFGKIHNAFAAIIQQYDDIEDFLLELDSRFSQMNQDVEHETEESGLAPTLSYH